MKIALNEQLDEVVRLSQSDAAQVITQALNAGMKQVHMDAVINAYFHGRMSREEAIKQIGLGSIIRAEEEREAARADVEWGLRG